MLSVVVLGFDVAAPIARIDESRRREGFARSLASLVEGVADGLIADATLVERPGAGLEPVADEAGCRLAEADGLPEGLRVALLGARYPDVFVLAAGFAVERGFFEEAHDALAFGGLQNAPRALRAEPQSLLSRLAPSLAPPVGLLARWDALAEASGADLKAWTRRLHARGLASLARRCL